jgi:hypothetical protein
VPGKVLLLSYSVDVLTRVVASGVEDVGPDNDRMKSTLWLGEAVE